MSVWSCFNLCSKFDIVVLSAISASTEQYHETLSTLRYAAQARAIQNTPTINEDKNVKIIRELREQIAQLQARVTANEQTNVSTT